MARVSLLWYSVYGVVLEWCHYPMSEMSRPREEVVWSAVREGRGGCEMAHWVRLINPEYNSSSLLSNLAFKPSEQLQPHSYNLDYCAFKATFHS